ncbi:hypothetical protein [Amycolatopsis sp. lyj-23]|uniref:hypothetical protein n=1 Tax=Amycolatopsis sp. lyj-23 TaxID=2789283 RepID=UPI00397DACBA
MLALVVDLDDELNHLEEGPQEILRRLREVHGQVRQRVEDREGFGTRFVWLGSGWLVNGRQPGRQIGTLGLEVVVPPPQRLGERVIRVSVHRLLQDRLLLLSQTVQGLLQLRALGIALVCLSGVHAGQLSVEDRSAFRTEYAVSEEGSDGVE